MAQWAGQYSGLTHETRVADIEAALRQAVAAWKQANAEAADKKMKAVIRLADRLIAARIKLARAKRRTDHEEEIGATGLSGILAEFGVVVGTEQP